MWRYKGEVHSTTTDRDSNQATHKDKMRSQSVRPIMGRILRETETQKCPSTCVKKTLSETSHQKMIMSRFNFMRIKFRIIGAVCGENRTYSS